MFSAVCGHPHLNMAAVAARWRTLPTGLCLNMPASSSRLWLAYRTYYGSSLRCRFSGTFPSMRKTPRSIGTRALAGNAREEAFEGTAAIGKVMAAQANFVRVKVESVEGPRVLQQPPRTRLLCVVRGLLKKIKQSVLVGDTVRVVGIDWVDGRGMVEEVLPRKSELSDPSVANVDHVVLVFAADMPPFQPVQVTRYLVSSEAAGMPVTLLVNKSDLVPPEQMWGIVEQVSGWGYTALPVSVVSGEGLDSLAERLRGKVAVVAGPSGAGKSSVINALRLRSVGLEGSLEAMNAEPTRMEGVAPDGDGARDDDTWTTTTTINTTTTTTTTINTTTTTTSSSSSVEGSSSAAMVGGGGQDRGALGRSTGPGDEGGGDPGNAAAAAQGVGAAVMSAELGDESSSSSSSSSNGDRPGGEGSCSGGQPAGPAGSGVHLSTTHMLEELELQAVGDVSQRIGRGKHTTRNVTLLELGGGGLLADTPGFSQPVIDMPAARLWEAFPEIRARLEEERCAFSNCQHLEEPGCVVRGEWERYSYYCDLHAELTQQEDVQRERAASKRKREGNVRFKSRAGGKQGAEARLETKTHRRVSRRSMRQELSELSKGQLQDEE